MNKNSLKIKKLVGLATLTALVIVLQLLSNNVTFGNLSITLALIPIAMGAILYGPLAGLFLGMVMGGIVLTGADTQTYFLSVNPAATVVLCLVKSGVAGLVSGLLFKLFAFIAKKQSSVNKKKALFAAGIIVAALVVPLVNTFIFIIGAVIFFSVYYPSLEAAIAAVIGTNFIVEFIISAALSPALVTLVKVLTRQYDLGFANDFSKFIEEDKEVEVEQVVEA